MASRPEQPTHSNWDSEYEQVTREDFPHISYQSSDELLTDDEDEDDLYGLLLSPLTTSIQDISTTADIPLGSPTAQLADSSLSLLQIQSPASPETNIVSIPQQFVFPPQEHSTKGKRSYSPPVSRHIKRLALQYNPSSAQTKSYTHITYIGETISDSTTTKQLSSVDNPKLDTRKELAKYYSNCLSKDWQERTIFTPDLNQKSPTGLARIDLYVYAIDANNETNSQRAKSKNIRALKNMLTPIERFYPQLWRSVNAPHTGHPVISGKQLEVLPFYTEPHENALRIERVPVEKFEKVPPAIPEPIIPLHHNPPQQQHSLSQQASHLLHCSEPIKFFEAIFRPYEINSIHQQMQTYRKQMKKLKWKEPTYEETCCFIGLLMWTSLVNMPNRRSYFADSQIYDLPHFRAHTTRDRFQQLFSMLHFANNDQIPATLNTAQRFEAKLGNLLTAVNRNSASLITPSRALSIDEMMVKFYGRSVLRQYIKAKPHKYGIKLWAICCACCGYSLKQNIYLGSTVEKVGGRDVVLQLTQPYLDKGHVVYCDRFFSNMDLAVYLRSRQTSMVGTSNLVTLPHDLDYLVRNMHPLTWAYKWFNYKANFAYNPRAGEGTKKQLHAEEPICLLIWMDKKYRTKDKKVVFITNCLPAIPETPQDQCHMKNIRHPNSQYTRQLIASPPILKAYNYRMGGVDKHDRLVGQLPIPLTSKRGYLKVFFHLLDSALVNAWIIFKTTIQARGEWNEAANRRYTLAWFKESVILSLCGSYTSRKYHPSHTSDNTILPIQSLGLITQHQVQPIKNLLPDFPSDKGRCLICKTSQRTACMACKQVYCYACGRQHLHQILQQYTSKSFVPEGEQSLPVYPESDQSLQPTTNVTPADDESNDSELDSSSVDDLW